jgi:hypothetical protein
MAALELDVVNGYMAVGYLLFLQEQIKGIIIIKLMAKHTAALLEGLIG